MIIIEDNRVFLTVLEPVSVLATSRKKVKRKLSAFFYDFVGASPLYQSPRFVVGRLGRGKKARWGRWERTRGLSPLPALYGWQNLKKIEIDCYCGV